MTFLYRGASEAHYKRTKGKLIPESTTPFSSYMHAGNVFAQAGSGMEAGCSPTNEVIKHEFQQIGFPTSGISTTPHLERAKFYATCGGKYESGYIYKIDRSFLSKHQVTEYIVSDHATWPSVPEDEEVIIVAFDFGSIPDDVIVSVDFFEN